MYTINFSTSSGGSYQEMAVLSDGVGVWEQHNVSHVSRQGGNFTEPSLNRSKEEFDPLGGHTIWQVTLAFCLTKSLVQLGWHCNNEYVYNKSLTDYLDLTYNWYLMWFTTTQMYRHEAFQHCTLKNTVPQSRQDCSVSKLSARTWLLQCCRQIMDHWKKVACSWCSKINCI